MPDSQNTKLINLLFSTKRTLMHKLAKKKGLNPINYFRAEILNYINSNKNSKMKDLSTFLGITPPSVTAMVDKLVQQHFIERKQDPKDRRKVLLIVTKKGRLFLHKVYNELHDIIEDALSPLNKKDKEALINIHYKLNRKK